MSERKLRESETKDRYGRDFPRAAPSDLELQLTIPPGLIPDDMVGAWFSDNNPTRINQKLAEWWVPVVDQYGKAVKVGSGSDHLHLMMIERTLYDEDHKLREERYRATVGEVINRPNFGDGIDGQVTTKNELKFTKDRDSIIL